MRSVAIWCKPKSAAKSVAGNQPPAEVELHLNLWKIPGQGGEHLRFLDIGIKLEHTEFVEDLKLYFPFQIDPKEVTDITSRFVHNNALIDAIFNENYKTTGAAQTKKTKVSGPTDELLFHVYQLSESDFEIESKYSGSLLRVKCAPCDEPTYYRLRVGGPSLTQLSTIQEPANSVFQSAFYKVEVIDFRVNQVRDLDRNLLEEMNAEHTFRIKKAHFFFICSSNDEILGSHEPYRSCRKLESDLWSEYIDLDEMKRNEAMLAYHWKWDNRKDFNVLIKSKFERNNYKTIMVYLMVIFVFGVIVNLSSSKLYDLGKSYFGSSSTQAGHPTLGQ